MRSVESTVKITPFKAILKKILFRICLYEHFKEGNYKIPNFCISDINGLISGFFKLSNSGAISALFFFSAPINVILYRR